LDAATEDRISSTVSSHEILEVASKEDGEAHVNVNPLISASQLRRMVHRTSPPKTIGPEHIRWDEVSLIPIPYCDQLIICILIQFFCSCVQRLVSPARHGLTRALFGLDAEPDENSYAAVHHPSWRGMTSHIGRQDQRRGMNSTLDLRSSASITSQVHSCYLDSELLRTLCFVFIYAYSQVLPESSRNTVTGSSRRSSTTSSTLSTNTPLRT
jgi:hypothetical protein